MHLPSPPGALWAVGGGGISYPLRVSRSKILGWISIRPLALCGSVQGSIGWENGRRKGSRNLSVQQPQHVEQSRYHVRVLLTSHPFHWTESNDCRRKPSLCLRGCRTVASVVSWSRSPILINSNWLVLWTCYRDLG